MESVLESKLNRVKDRIWEFVDWKAIDQMILDAKKNDWVAGIQCKIFMDTGKSFMSYRKILEESKEFSSIIPKDKTLIMFCGGVSRSKKDKIKNSFQNIGWKTYYLWEDINSYNIDQSFYNFVAAIEKLGKA